MYFIIEVKPDGHFHPVHEGVAEHGDLVLAFLALELFTFKRDFIDWGVVTLSAGYESGNNVGTLKKFYLPFCISQF